MVESESFPYIEGKDGNESQQHINLKGLAVYWLLQRGFELEDITEEYPVPRQSYDADGRGTRYADIHAERDGSEVFIECETKLHTANSVSMAGSQKAKNGEEVYMFGEDGIHELIYGEVEFEGTGETGKVLYLEHHSNLPMLDLSAYE